ncbi:MAG: enoyl-CoA hydratase/isomerase family protein [Candidatus Lokiarchaeia archaeon]
MSVVSTEIKDRIAIVTITREEKLNAINLEVLEGLYKALTDVAANEEVRAVIITGQGDRAFSTGGDLELFQIENYEDIERGFVLGREMYETIESMPKPVIAAVNGFAAAGGLVLVLYSDIIIASDRASFMIPDVKLGILPIYKFSKKLTLAVGSFRAREILMTGRPVDANTAERIGLVNKVVPHEKLEEESYKLAKELANNAPLVLAFIKDSMTKCFSLDDREYVEYEYENFRRVWHSEDKKEGLKSFIERRRPHYRGK